MNLNQNINHYEIADSTHGDKSLKSLLDRARQTGKPQGMWKNNTDAANFVKNNWGKLVDGENIIKIPKGMGQVIMPDGTIVEVTEAIIVKNSVGTANLIKTAYPIL